MYLHIIGLPGTTPAASMTSMSRRRDLGRLSPCVCNTLRMAARAVTQLYDDVLRPSGLRVTQFSILATFARMGEANLKELEDALAIDQTTLTRSLGLLERDGLIERGPHPDGRVKAMRLTSKGKRSLEVARPLWARAQDRVLRQLGAKAWGDAQRRLTHVFHVAVTRELTRSSRDVLGGNPERAGDGIRRGGHVQHGASVEDGKRLVTDVETTLELLGRDLRAPETAEKPPALDELDAHVSGERRPDDDDERVAEASGP